MSNPIALRLGLTSLVATTGIVVYSLNPTVNKPPPSTFPKPPPGYAAAATPAGSDSKPAGSSRFRLEKRQHGEKADLACMSEKREDINKVTVRRKAEEKGWAPEFYDTLPASGMHQDL